MKELLEYLAKQKEYHNHIRTKYRSESGLHHTSDAKYHAYSDIEERINQLLLHSVVKSSCDCGGYASNKTEDDRGKCDNCGKEKM